MKLHLSSKRWMIFGIILISIVCALLAVFYLKTTTTIYRTNWGYFPKHIAVDVGTTINFVNMSDIPMWPASDVHPNHDVYADFDPRRGIDPGENWSFTFDRSGQWLFHDHLSTQFTGQVTVYDETGNADFDCSGLEGSACWALALDFAVRDHGIAGAYETFTEIHQKDPLFATSCHSYAHDVGLKTYVYHGLDIKLLPETSYCNAGFFHGFMEGVISDVDDMSTAKAFCDRVKNELSETFPIADEQCRHGIGHGLLEHFIVTRPDLLAAPEKLLREAVIICEEVTDNYDHLMRCTSGAYNVYRDFIAGNDDYLEYARPENLYAPCAAATERHEKEGCYWELSKLLAGIGTIKQLLRDIESTGDSDLYTIEELIVEEDRFEYVPFATRSWADIVGKHVVNEFSEDVAIRACDIVPEYAREACLVGVFEGAFTSAEPIKEYEVLHRLCRSKELKEEEQALCFMQMQRDMSATYSPGEFTPFCEVIPEEYKDPKVCAMTVGTTG